MKNTQVTRLIKRENELARELELVREKIRFESTEELIMAGSLNIIADFDKKLSSRSVEPLTIQNRARGEYDIFFNRQGSTITCTITSKYDRTLKGVGVATCDAEDKFDYKKGIRLADAKARADLYKNMAKRIQQAIIGGK